jgi:hypothetical protein
MESVRISKLRFNLQAPAIFFLFKIGFSDI